VQSIQVQVNPKSLALRAYLDESGHSADPKLHYAGMAGFVAPADAWEEFEALWEAILRRLDVKEGLHMKNFAHSNGEFKGWSKDKREDLLGSLIGVITTIRPVPTGSVVSVEDFNSLTEDQRGCFKDPYYMAFQQCTRGACLQAVGHEPEKVAMVYAYQKEFGTTAPQGVFSVDQAGNAEKLWHVMKNETIYGRWMGAYSSSTPKELIPLQAADLLAYELTKEFENLLFRPSDKMRWGLRQILPIALADSVPLFHFCDRREMLRFIKESQMPCQVGVEEIADTTLQKNHARSRTMAWLERRLHEK
jgi:hypothetical protein